jgi:bis(5'-nucleosidyl)-tetraphosphatase
MAGTPILSSGIIPVLRGTADRYLLLRVFQYWDFPKGRVESGEHPLQAARRELREESGIDHLSFTWGKDFIETEPYSYGKIARYYVGEVFSSEVQLLANPILQRAEHDEYRWVSYEEACALIVPRVRRVLDWAEQKICVQSAPKIQELCPSDISCK